jgi:hypothetical protein
MSEVEVREAPETVTMMSEAQARRITDKIRKGAENLRDLLLQAHDGGAWKALGYGSWGAYVTGEFDVNPGHAGRLIWQAKAIRQISEATGVEPQDVPLSMRGAVELGPQGVAEVAEAVAKAPDASVMDKARQLREEIGTRRKQGAAARQRAVEPEGNGQAVPAEAPPRPDQDRLDRAAHVLLQVVTMPAQYVAEAFIGLAEDKRTVADGVVGPEDMADLVATWAGEFQAAIDKLADLAPF